MTTLCEKYRGKCFADIKGQDLAIRAIKDYVKKFTDDRDTRGRKALLLHGPPGTGKTTLAHVVASEIKAEIFELNSSDLRNRTKLQEVLKPAIEQQSLFKKTKIILVDEVDGVTGSEHGGVPELISLINNATIPIIITANDAWSQKLNDLRKVCELIRLKELSYTTIKEILKEIATKEKISLDEDVLVSIAVKSKGDLRAAINDLQSISSPLSENEAKLKPENIHERNKEEDIFTVMQKIFKLKPSVEMLDMYDNVNMPLEEISLWIEANIPKEYKGEELAKAYEALSKADIFKHRIMRQQYWRFLVYQNIFLSYAISAAKKTPHGGFTKYDKPTRILKIWLANKRNEYKKTISHKYAMLVHMNKKRAEIEFKIILPILKSQKVQEDLQLNEEEIKYLDRC